MEFARFGPITKEGLTAKSCLSPSTKRQLNNSCQGPRIFNTKMDQTQVHLSNDGLTEDKTDSTQIWLTFTNMFAKRLDVRSSLDGRECWMTLYIRNDCNVEGKKDYISVLDSTILRVYYSLGVWRFNSHLSGGLRLRNYRAVVGNHNFRFLRAFVVVIQTELRGWEDWAVTLSCLKLLSLTKDCLLGLDQVSQGFPLCRWPCGEGWGGNLI